MLTSRVARTRALFSCVIALATASCTDSVELESYTISPDVPVAKIDLILDVANRTSEDIGPAGGAPYPRPAYDSGWQPIAKGGQVVLNHNLGGNRDNYVVDLQFKNISGEVHNYLYGAMTWAE